MTHWYGPSPGEAIHTGVVRMNPLYLGEGCDLQSWASHSFLHAHESPVKAQILIHWDRGRAWNFLKASRSVDVAGLGLRL